MAKYVLISALVTAVLIVLVVATRTPECVAGFVEQDISCWNYEVAE